MQKSHKINLLCYLESPKHYFNTIDKYLINHTDVKYFRYHSAGDIVDEKYLKGMVKIARLHPEVRFLAYTKKYEIINTYMDKGYRIPKNLKILFSNWTRDFKIENPHHRPMTYVDFGNDTTPELPKKKIFKCPGSCINCKKCWTLTNTESVIFKKH